MKVRVKERLTGLYNGQQWPAPGEMIDLPEVVAESMATAGQVEIVTDESAEETATPNLDQLETATPPKRKRGRPRKYPLPS